MLPTPEEAKLDPNILTLGQATKYCGVSDTTLKRLIHENILAVEQLAPYAPLEINRADLDSEPVASILERLKDGQADSRGGTSWEYNAVCLNHINRLHNGGIMRAHSDWPPNRSAG